MFAKIIVSLVVVFALFGSLNADIEYEQEEDDCPQICPLLYDPICGTDGLNYREFSSPCELKANNCRQDQSGVKQFMATALDMCRTEMVPTLDKLLQKLGNLNLATAECLKPCTLIFEPVCISNGKFRFLASNKCIISTINCALGNKTDAFSVLQYGRC